MTCLFLADDNDITCLTYLPIQIDNTSNFYLGTYYYKKVAQFAPHVLLAIRLHMHIDVCQMACM